MKTKFTPGPWRAVKSTTFKNNDLKEYRWVGFGPVGYETPVLSIHLPIKEHEANAHLIAAAPEMLEALQLGLKAIDAALSEGALRGRGAAVDNGRHAHNVLAHAIRKARGG